MKEHKLEDKFNPKNFEEEIYKRWEGKEYFKNQVKIRLKSHIQ